MNATEHRPMTAREVKRLSTALRGNADQNLAILMGRDTEFMGADDRFDADVTDTQTIDAVKSCATHY